MNNNIKTRQPIVVRNLTKSFKGETVYQSDGKLAVA